MKRTQVDGKKYKLPDEEIKIQKLIKRGMSLKSRLQNIKDDLAAVESELVDLATARRQAGQTTVTLKGISGDALITYREAFVPAETVGALSGPLGDLWGRFFHEEPKKFKPLKELKTFLNGGTDAGLGDDADRIRRNVLAHVEKKATKPNVKFLQKED